jgi:hypothetical protein
VIRTPTQAPRADAVCERFLGSVRRECADHTLILGERHLGRVLAEYVGYFNRACLHCAPAPPVHTPGEAIAVPVLGGLHHEDRNAA